MYFSKILLAAVASAGFAVAAPTLNERAIACTRDDATINACPWSKYVRSEEKREFVERAVACTRDDASINACPWSKYVRSPEEKRELIERSEACTRDVNACPWSKYVRSEEAREFAERAAKN